MTERKGDQSLGVPNGIGDMATALEHALELEKRGVIPYVIDEQGFFKSTRTYPRITIFTNDVMMPVAGDTILDIKGVKCMPIISYRFQGGLIMISGNEGKILHVFDGGQPITGQCYQPIIDNINDCNGVYVTFEVYGPKFRKALIDYRDKTRHEDCGVKLKISNLGMNYQVFGCNNSGFMAENHVVRI